MPTKKKTENLETTDRVEPVHTTLKVTSVQVYPLREPVGKTRALARVVLNDQLQLTGMRVVDGANGLFIAFPNDPTYKGEDYRSIFYPVTRDLRDHIEQSILDVYKQATKGASDAD